MKIKFKHRADNYFWVTALFIFIVGAIHHLVSKDTSFDINVHDTYYVIDHFYLTLLFTFIYAFLGFIYRMLYTFKLKMSKALAKAHTKITVFGVMAYWLLSGYIYIAGILSKSSSVNGDAFNLGLLLIWLMVIVVQPLLIINIIIGLVRGRENKE